ncbi:MAG: hypothetical protein IKS17_08325 [Firmicutes bacterium]|nr:hypothetical protein [Bacillota bacterium]
MDEILEKSRIGRKIAIITTAIQLIMLFPANSVFILLWFNEKINGSIWFMACVWWLDHNLSLFAEIIIILSTVYYIVKDREYTAHYNNRHDEYMPYDRAEHFKIIMLIPLSLAALFLSMIGLAGLLSV